MSLYYRRGCCSKKQCTAFTVTKYAGASHLYYSTDLLINDIVLSGLKYPDGTLVSNADYLNQLDVGLKPLGGHFSSDGVIGSESVSTTADAKIEYPAGGGEWRDLDPRGDQFIHVFDGQNINNDFGLNIKQGSIVVISGSVCKSGS